jgi:hypothetical protein
MIDEQDIARLKEIFVTRSTCDEKRSLNENHIQRLELTMAKLSTKMSIMIGILGAIGVSILSVVVKFLFGA